LRRPPDLLNRAGLDDAQHDFRYCQGAAAVHLVYVFLLKAEVPGVVIPPRGQDGPYKVDTDLWAAGKRFDVKCSARQSIPTGQRDHPFFGYVFVRTNRPRSEWRIIGWLERETYWSRCEVVRKGETFEGGYPVQYDQGWIRDDLLATPSSLIDALKAL